MQKRNMAIFTIVGIFAAFGGYMLLLNLLTSEESRVRSVINEVVDAAETRNLWKLSGYIHPEFRAETKNLDRDTALAVVRQVFLQYRDITVRLRGLSIEIIDDQTAQARFVATVKAARSAGANKEDLLRYRGDERFLITLKKIDGDWEIYRSEVLRSSFN